MNYDFDTPVSRRGTCSNKWDGAAGQFHTNRVELPFSVADMDFACPSCVTDALQERIRHPIFGYSTAGDRFYQAAQGWFARRHGALLEKEWMYPTTGIITGLAFSMRALLQPGDRVMAFSPVYHPFFAIIESGGFLLEECELLCHNGRYTLDYERIEMLLKSGVKGILFCNPHNPVGHVWSREEMQSLVSLCAKYGTCLFSDEAHADFSLFGNTYTPAFSFPELHGQCVTCISGNKSFNIPGISTGILVIPDPANKEKIAAALNGVWIKTPTILSIVACEAGFCGADEWLDAVHVYLEGNSLFLRDFLERETPGITAAEHQGTYLMWLDCSCFRREMGELSYLLADHYGVGLPSGENFRGDGGHHLRINIACARSVLGQGMERLAECYRAEVG
ncbi:MAG: PatB family C-S lyase [Clostridiales bacterium]|nr:PatB family C-S lyase [Clostridiales bacterium]